MYITGSLNLSIPMKRSTILIILFILVNVAVFVFGYRWREQRRQAAEELVKVAERAERYAGATGPTITAFDNRTDRWIAEMKEETIETTLLTLTDFWEYFWLGRYCGPFIFDTVERREETFYDKDIDDIFANRRFRKAFEDIKKTDRKKAAELLTKNIRENVAALRIILQEHKDNASRGDYRASVKSKELGFLDENAYRLRSLPDSPPCHYGRRYAVFSYILLAAHFELPEVRPAVEEVIQLAKEEFEYFNSMDVVLDEKETNLQEWFHKGMILQMSLYRPSLLVTATHCDPKWNVEKKKALGAKLVTREIVDWESRALENDHDAVTGFLPVVPYHKTLKIRYYEGVTEDEFDDFFGK